LIYGLIFISFQLAIIANNEVLAFFNNEAVLDQAPSAVVQKVASYREYRRSMTPDEAFRSLCPKLRSIFSKRHFPMVLHNRKKIICSISNKCLPTGNFKSNRERSP